MGVKGFLGFLEMVKVAIKKMDDVFEDEVDFKRILREINEKFLISLIIKLMMFTYNL